LNSVNTASESTSASLIQRARDADTAAWRRLSAIYGPLVYRWCRRARLQDADAADVMQEVFRAILGGLAAFDPDREGGFRGWLHGITRHKVADHFRHHDATQNLTGDVAAISEVGLADWADPDEAAQADDAAILLHAALDAIRGDFNDHNWQAFERTVLRGESPTDVAADLGLTPAAVRQAKFRVLRRLRRELDAM
jgi:RNA polymerase sigma-70 factor (ECF subfamily)